MFNFQTKAMKKIINYLGVFILVLITAIACQDDDATFGSLNAPTNLEVNFEILGVDAENPNGDGSGKVAFTATANGATSYKYVFSDGNVSVPNGTYTKQFSTPGINTYIVTVLAYGTGGSATSTSVEVTVFSNFSDPEAVELLTGGSSKVWYYYGAKPGHLGVGPNDGGANTGVPSYYSAGVFEKMGSPDSACLYDNALTFTKDGDVLKYTLDNGGNTFYNASFTGTGSDLCMPLDTSGEKIVSLVPSSSNVPADQKRGTAMNFSDGGFMGYYIQQTTYEILSITEDEMHVRAVMGTDEALAWYHIFTTKTIEEQQQGGGDEFELVWEDDFNTDGAPNPDNWTMELGNGNNGWGNSEKQYYRAENAVVQGGSLVITARKEDFGGQEYTSARMKSEGKFDFTYGKVEFRAKLPTGGGTWPALWMLGSNYATNTWPACGEIDIMEHVGNNQDVIQSALHLPGNSGGDAIVEDVTVNGVSADFHLYTVIWTAESIQFLVDDQVYHTYTNSAGTPFNADFFLIMNVAMGGNLGGAISPTFQESSMEVDYVRVYQQQ